MNNIQHKMMIGILFSGFATFVSTLFKYHNNYFKLFVENAEAIGMNFIFFFLIGYVVLGNLLAIKKK